MTNAPRYLAIVPARAGSKRIPDKNIVDLGGVPLMTWSIRAALECPQISTTIVSTDSEHYQRIAIAAGAQCPRLRTQSLASDTASSSDVVEDVLRSLSQAVQDYAGLVLLQPTSPLRTSQDIAAAIDLHRSSGAPAVVSVCLPECPPAWIGKLGKEDVLDDFIPSQFRGLRSQDMADYYRINGAVYVIGIREFREEQGFMPKGTRAYIMPRARSIDIDTPLDLEIARCLLHSNIVE